MSGQWRRCVGLVASTGSAALRGWVGLTARLHSTTPATHNACPPPHPAHAPGCGSGWGAASTRRRHENRGRRRRGGTRPSAMADGTTAVRKWPGAEDEHCGCPMQEAAQVLHCTVYKWRTPSSSAPF